MSVPPFALSSEFPINHTLQTNNTQPHHNIVFLYCGSPLLDTLPRAAIMGSDYAS